jgi:hypothetical protein
MVPTVDTLTGAAIGIQMRCPDPIARCMTV